jgi:hypothetical protein
MAATPVLSFFAVARMPVTIVRFGFGEGGAGVTVGPGAGGAGVVAGGGAGGAVPTV